MMNTSFELYLKKQHDCLIGKDKYFVFLDDPSVKEFNSCGRDLKKDEFTKIHTDLLPQVIAGDLINGKIFLCVLNPGFSNQDYEDEIIIRDALLRQLNQDNPSMFWLEEEYKYTEGGKWWRKKFDQGDKKKSLVENVVKKYAENDIHITKKDVFSMLSKLVVDIELLPYHSKTKPKPKLIDEFNSVKVIKSFVHNELIPNAKQNDQIVCFVRAIKDWNVTEKEKKNDCVFRNIDERNGRGNRFISFSVNQPLGGFVIDHLRKLTEGFSIYKW